MSTEQSRVSRKSIVHYKHKIYDQKLKFSELIDKEKDKKFNKLFRSGSLVLLPQTSTRDSKSKGNVTSHRNDKKSQEECNKQYCMLISDKKYPPQSHSDQMTKKEFFQEKRFSENYLKGCNAKNQDEFTDVNIDDQPSVAVTGEQDQCAPALKQNKCCHSDSKNESQPLLETKVIGCKFELTYRLPRFGWFRSSETKSKDFGLCGRCRQRQFTKVAEQQPAFECSKVVLPTLGTDGTISKVNKCDTPKQNCVSELSFHENYDTYVSDIYRDQIQSGNYTMEDGSNLMATTLNRPKRKPKKKKTLSFRNDTYCNNNKNEICLDRQEISPVDLQRFKNLWALQNLLYFNKNEQLHVLYRNLNYKLLQSFTVLASTEQQNPLEDDDDDDYNNNNNNIDTLPAGSSMFLHKIDYEAVMSNRMSNNGYRAQTDFSRVSKSHTCGLSAVRIDSDVDGRHEAITPQVSSILLQRINVAGESNLGKSGKNQKSKGHRTKKCGVVDYSLDIQTSPEPSDHRFSGSQLDKMLDDMGVDQMKACVDNCSRSSDGNRTIEFSKMAHGLHDEQTQYVKLYIQISSIYNRLKMLEKQIKKFYKGIGFQCNKDGTAEWESLPSLSYEFEEPGCKSVDGACSNIVEEDGCKLKTFSVICNDFFEILCNEQPEYNARSRSKRICDFVMEKFYIDCNCDMSPCVCEKEEPTPQ